MGRSFKSIRMGEKDVSARWLKASKALKKEDQVYGQKVAEDGMYALNRSFPCSGILIVRQIGDLAGICQVVMHRLYGPFFPLFL